DLLRREPAYGTHDAGIAMLVLRPAEQAVLRIKMRGLDQVAAVHPVGQRVRGYGDHLLLVRLLRGAFHAAVIATVDDAEQLAGLFDAAQVPFRALAADQAALRVAR